MTDKIRQEKSEEGILYGIGVGPGDPELMTIKALRILKECDVVFTPGKSRMESTAYGIAVQALLELEEKDCVCVEIPMVHDRKQLNQAYDQAADLVEERLCRGQKAAFLNLGDVTLYATYLHVHRRIQKRGFQAELINGIPSFCAAAAVFGTGLAEGHEQFHILAKPGQVEAGLALSGTKVIMKSSRQSSQFRQQLETAEQEGQEVFLAENCGMPGQRLQKGAGAVTGQEGYYSLILVKEKKKLQENRAERNEVQTDEA